MSQIATEEYLIESPVPLIKFESRGCELFCHKLNTPLIYGTLIAIFPTEEWCRKAAIKLNQIIDAPTVPNFRIVNLELENE